MSFIALPEAPEKSAAEQIAESELIRLNVMLDERVALHRGCYSRFWDNPQATPDDILKAMDVQLREAGAPPTAWLQAASESAGHIARLAAIVGKSLDDLLPPESYQPRREFIINPQTGEVTLAP